MDMEQVVLPPDHPGTSDPIYLGRRQEIAALSASQRPGEAPPHVDYSPVEDDVWCTVSAALADLHERYAVDEYRAGAAALNLPNTRVPQLSDVSARLASLTGWRLQAVPGLVPTRMFYGSLASRTFMSTQYVRHPSVPFYTPEPDIIHELIGHVNALASPRIAAVYEAAGRASLRADTPADLERFSRVFWFTLEFGVAMQHGGLRTFGAGLLSSFGEIQAFRNASIREVDVEAMATFDYDISHFQEVLFSSPSFAAAEERMLAFFDGFGL